MTVQKDKVRGTWSAVFSYRDAITGEKHWKRKRGFATKREAQRWEMGERDNVAPINHNVKFSDMVDKWEAFNQSSEHMKRKHHEHFEIRFKDCFDKPIASITKAQLLEWRTWLSSTNFSTRTKNTTIQYVKSVFKFAHDFYDLKNPTIYLNQFKRTDEEVLAEIETWTPDEFNQFLACVDKKVFRYFFDCLFWTGMRKGECIALYKADLQGNMLTIKHSQEHAQNGLKPTKTRQQRRIMIDDRLQSELEELMVTDGPYLFGGESPLTPSSIQREFTSAIKKSKVKRIRIHDLRHSHATWLINNGASIVSVSKRLGHSDINMTLKVYTHVLQEQDDRLIDLINTCHR